MKAPDKIYLQRMPSNQEVIDGWTVEPVKHTVLEDIEYIRKDTLLEWLRKEADKSYNSFAREELGLEARHRGLDFEEVIRKIKSL